MLYILTQVSRKWLLKTPQMECSGTLFQPAPPQLGRSPTMCKTDADLLTLYQICKNLRISETKLDPCMPQTSDQFSNDVFQTLESRPRKFAAYPKKTQIKSKKATIKPILKRINAPSLPNGRYQKLQPPAQPESSSACPSPTTCTTVVAATWTSSSDATSTSPIMNSSRTTSSFSDLVSLIYFTFIFDHLKSNSNLELNLHKNCVCKFLYPQLILFLDNALSAQPHSYKSLDSVIFFALRFLKF